MMDKHLPLKILLSLLAISLFLCVAVHFSRSDKNASVSKSISSLSGLKEVIPAPSGPNLPRATAKLLTPPPPLQEGKANGQLSLIKFEQDLETSIRKQDAPAFWLEYTDDKGQLVKTELSPGAKEILREGWQNVLEYCVQNLSARDYETKVTIQKDYITNTAVVATRLERIKIATPLEKRNISENEGFALAHVMAQFAVDRFSELNNMSQQVITQKTGYPAS